MARLDPSNQVHLEAAEGWLGLGHCWPKGIRQKALDDPALEKLWVNISEI